MAASGEHEAHAPAGGKTVAVLESLDNWAHIVVAVFFILMAGTVIVHMGFIFSQQFSLIVPGSTLASTQHEMAPATGTEDGSKTEHATEQAERPATFTSNSLDLLSNILFVVILLELLRTIITYLQTHNIEAIMQEFLVVGIISSVRKILLVGAEASLTGSKGVDFIQEATGVVIDIVGILLLIYGLVMLRRVFGAKDAPPAHQA